MSEVQTFSHLVSYLAGYSSEELCIIRDREYRLRQRIFVKPTWTSLFGPNPDAVEVKVRSHLTDSESNYRCVTIMSLLFPDTTLTALLECLCENNSNRPQAVKHIRALGNLIHYKRENETSTIAMHVLLGRVNKATEKANLVGDRNAVEIWKLVLGPNPVFCAHDYQGPLIDPVDFCRYIVQPAIDCGNREASSLAQVCSVSLRSPSLWRARLRSQGKENTAETLSLFQSSVAKILARRSLSSRRDWDRWLEILDELVALEEQLGDLVHIGALWDRNRWPLSLQARFKSLIPTSLCSGPLTLESATFVIELSCGHQLKTIPSFAGRGHRLTWLVALSSKLTTLSKEEFKCVFTRLLPNVTGHLGADHSLVSSLTVSLRAFVLLAYFKDDIVCGPFEVDLAESAMLITTVGQAAVDEIVALKDVEMRNRKIHEVVEASMEVIRHLSIEATAYTKALDVFCVFILELYRKLRLIGALPSIDLDLDGLPPLLVKLMAKQGLEWRCLSGPSLLIVMSVHIEFYA